MADVKGVSCITVEATNIAATQNRSALADCDYVECHSQTCKINDELVDDHIDVLVMKLREDSSDSSNAEDRLNYFVYLYYNENIYIKSTHS